MITNNISFTQSDNNSAYLLRSEDVTCSLTDTPSSDVNIYHIAQRAGIIDASTPS